MPSTKLTQWCFFVLNALSRIFFFLKPSGLHFLILCVVWELSVCDVWRLHLHILLMLFLWFFFFLSVFSVLLWFIYFNFILFLRACLFSNERERESKHEDLGREVGRCWEELGEGKP